MPFLGHNLGKVLLVISLIVEITGSNTNTSIATARKKDKFMSNMMEKVMPWSLIPFVISTTIMPFILLNIKMLLIKSALIAKIAVGVLLLNFLRPRADQGGIYNHDVFMKNMAMSHYGFSGGEEYGAYINR